MENMMKKWGQLTIISALVLVLLAACGANDKEVNVNDKNEAAADEETVNNDGNESDNNESANNVEFPVTVTDSSGKEVTIDEEPETMVSLFPSNTEIIFELGAGDRLIGVSEYCNYPAETADIDVVGAMDIDAELILSLQPDLALVQTTHAQNNSNILEQFEEAGIDVIVIEGGNSFEDVYDAIRLLGTVTGTSDNAENIVSDMEDSLAEIQEQASEITEEDRKKVWVEVAPSPDIFTTGQGTFMHEMLETIHATNAAEEEEGWISLTEEEIVTLNPDVIITTYGYYVEDPVKEVLSRDGWSDVSAVQHEKIYDVDNDTVTRAGPRLIEGVETLAKLVYPEVFE